jgi:hypothetical protein
MTGDTSWSGSGPGSYRSRSGTGRRPRRPTAPCPAGESSGVSTSPASPPGRRSTSRASAARSWTWWSMSGSVRPATGAGRRCAWTTRAGGPCTSAKDWGMPLPRSARRPRSSTCARPRTRRAASTACIPLTRTSASTGRRIPNPCFPGRTPRPRPSNRRATPACCLFTLTARPTWEACARRRTRGTRYLAGYPAVAAACCAAMSSGRAPRSAVRHSPIGGTPGPAQAP